MPVNSNHNKPYRKNNRSSQQPQKVEAKPIVNNPHQPNQNHAEADNGEKSKNGVRIRPLRHENVDPSPALVSFTKLLAYATTALALATIFLAVDTHRLANQAVAQTDDNKQALESAKKAADAATRTATSTRAWLCSNGSQTLVGNDAIVNGVHIGQTAAVVVQVNNTGYSPALNVRTSGDYKIVGSSEPAPKFEDQQRISVSEKGVIGPGTGIQFGPFILTADNVTKLSLGGERLYVHTYLEYDDVFRSGEKHITNLTFDLRFAGFNNVNGVAVPTFRPVAFGPDNQCS